MKESGMEKLIELLNEYERERVNHSMLDFIPYGEKSLNDLSVAQVINKKYGFIKWLVDNDKIDFSEKYELEFKLANVEFRGEWELVRDYTVYEQLLMLLSIQDNPIEFLISILK